MATIIRGTTPTVRFKFNRIDVQNIGTAILVIKQNGHPRIERQLDTATVGESDISWVLTQEETLSLIRGVPSDICCDWKLFDTTRGRSKVLTAQTEDPGKDRVI